MSDSDHKAIAQALGYTYQFQRATYHLLASDNTVVSVAVEEVDDVSVQNVSGTSVREQDKTMLNPGYPLTDRSQALWKTLSIWSDAVLSDPNILSSTEFHIVTNGKVDLTSLAARISDAKTNAAMDLIEAELLSLADNLRSDLQDFGGKLRALGPGLVARLVGKIFVFDNVSATFGGKLEELQSLRFLGELQRTAIFDNAAGWVRRTVLAAATNGQPTVIDRAAFDSQVKALWRRVAVAPLAAVFGTSDSDVDPANYRAHGFFLQLDWIDTDPTFVRQCVIHYVQAQAARVKWTDADAVSEASLHAYEDDLKIIWNLQVRRQSYRSYSSPILKGTERLIETLSQDSSLEGQPMPKAITCGNFHALADFDDKSDPEIGWHPEFEKLAKEGKEGS